MLSKQLRTIALTACLSVVSFRKVRFTATAVATQTSGRVSHDAIQRLLSDEQAQWSRQLWKQVKKFMKKHPGGYLIIDDTIIGKDKDSWKTEMAAKFWSSSEKRYLYGQSVVLLIWTDGRTRVLLDIRFYVRGGSKTKYDLALEMLRTGKDRNIKPKAVLFDSWYASARMMQAVRKMGWHWITKIKCNRILIEKGRTDSQTNKGKKRKRRRKSTKGKRRRKSKQREGIRVDERWRTTYGSTVAMLSGGIEALIVKDGQEFFASSLLDWKPREVKKAYRKRWIIEECIKLLKSEFGLETCQARTIPTIRAHAYICLMCFNTLEQFRVKHNISTLYHIRSVLFNQPIPLQRAWNLHPSLFA